MMRNDGQTARRGARPSADKRGLCARWRVQLGPDWGKRSPCCLEGADPGEKTCIAAMGVEIETITPGDGRTFPKMGMIAVVHYTGMLQNGKKFDSSRDRNQSFKFKMGKGEVIKGFEEGVTQMSLGQRAKLTFTADMAYGATGHPGVIPPNATLVFDVELLRME